MSLTRTCGSSVSSAASTSRAVAKLRTASCSRAAARGDLDAIAVRHRRAIDPHHQGHIRPVNVRVEQADAECLAAFPDYVGIAYEESTLGFAYYYGIDNFSAAALAVSGLLSAVPRTFTEFLIARFLGRDFIESLVGRQVVICCECSEGLLTKIIFFSRLLPLISFDVVSYGAGLTRMSLRSFALATLLGSIPMTFIYHGFGSVLKVSTMTGLVLGLVIVAILFALPYLADRWDIKKFRPQLVVRNGEDPCAPPDKKD